jgi:transcriptional regulator with XRE-family HTH domain
MSEVLSDRIVAARKSLGLTQATCAALTGMPLSSLKKYESGQSLPGVLAVGLFCQLNINIHWLVTGEGEMTLNAAAANQVSRNSLAYALDIINNSKSSAQPLKLVSEELTADEHTVVRAFRTANQDRRQVYLDLARPSKTKAAA